jgi:hypothetical protein
MRAMGVGSERVDLYEFHHSRGNLYGPAIIGGPVKRVPFLLGLSVLLLLPSSAAHMTEEGCHEESETNLCHLTLNVKDLPAGDEHVYALHSERLEGDFPIGWIVTAFAGIQGDGQVLANLTLASETRHTWTWSANTYSSNSTRVDAAGHYELRLKNPGTTSVRYAFYFDQSCNCAVKFIPINGGFVLFNYDLPADRDVRIGFPTIDGWHLKARLALLTDERGEWPRDFEVLETLEQKNKGWLRFDFHSEKAATYYVFVEAPEGVTNGPDGRPVAVELTPLLEVDEGSTVPAWGTVGSLLTVCGLVWLRRRA